LLSASAIGIAQIVHGDNAMPATEWLQMAVYRSRLRHVSGLKGDGPLAEDGVADVAIRHRWGYMTVTPCQLLAL